MSVGIRHDDLRRRNRAMVIAAVRRSGQPSRTELAAATGLSHSTISAISSDLIAESILVEAKGGEIPSLRRGRPQIGLSLNPDAAAVLTVVLSLNFLAVAALDYAGQRVGEASKKLDTLALSRQQLQDECVTMVRNCIEALPDRAILRIAFAVQGITDLGARTLLWSPITPHGGIPFADILEQEFGVPVTVENDCNMIALALRWREPARYKDDFIAILLSHGIGMGMVLKGELFTGTHSSGGEFGHMVHRPEGALCRCGRRGCVEAYAGNYAIWRNAHGLPQTSKPDEDIVDDDMLALAARARRADGPERDAFRKAGDAIGYALSNLFALIDPAPVCFVGVGAAAFDLLGPHIRAVLDKTAGGQHSRAIAFDTQTDEFSLLREGCAMTALATLDEAVAAGTDTSRRNVA